MGDYLWDKTGEPDAEVERLEALLGGLAHRPAKLELPAAAEAPARRAPLWRFAAAAALLLAVLAGALVALRVARPKGPAPVADSAPPPTSGPRESPSPPPAPKGEAPPGAGRGGELARRTKRARRPSAPAGREAAAGGERARAKEQLVYALRLTGVKLEEVRRKVQGEEDHDAAEARSRTR